MMKLVVRIFNLAIAALALVATIFMFTMPLVSFSSKITLDVEQLTGLIPDNEFKKYMKINEALGTNTIDVGISFKLSAADSNKAMNGDREVINENFIKNNLDTLTHELYQAVDLIGDYAVRTVIRETIGKELTAQIESAIESFNDEYEGIISFNAEDVMEDAGLGEQYLNNFAISLYNSLRSEEATITSIAEVINGSEGPIQRILDTIKEYGLEVPEENVAGIKDNVKSTIKSALESFNLVKEDGESVESITNIAYMFATNFIKEDLAKDPKYTEELEKGEETWGDYSNRLLYLFVTDKVPDMAYTIMGYVTLGLFISLFFFAGLWVSLIAVTIYRTFFSKKTWTFFGAWFWILGPIQLIFGFGMTIVGKFVLPQVMAQFDIPIVTSLILAPRSFLFIPSLIYVVFIFVGIAYAIVTKPVKDEYKRNKKGV